jgi:hypothetical protein
MQCPINTWSAGGANVPCTQCPANTASPSTSTNVDACVCLPGYKPGASGCVQCVSGEVCPGGTSVGVVVVVCPPGAISPPGSDSPAACVCRAGYGKLLMDTIQRLLSCWLVDFLVIARQVYISHKWLQSTQAPLLASICWHCCLTTLFWSDCNNDIHVN